MADDVSPDTFTFFYILVLTMLGKNGLTEHLATISKVSAGDSKMVDIALHM